MAVSCKTKKSITSFSMTMKRTVFQPKLGLHQAGVVQHNLAVD